MRIIGISGKARHGKDTCAAIMQTIAHKHGRNIGTWALADALKANVYAEAQGKYSLREIWGDKPPEVRHLLQQRGTELGRMVYGEDLWTLQCEAYIYLMRQRFPFLDALIFTDVRFPNEVVFIQNGGSVTPTDSPGTALRIKSNRATLEGDAATHPSETALDSLNDDEFDGVIINNNNTTLDDLAVQLEPIVSKLFLT